MLFVRLLLLAVFRAVFTRRPRSWTSRFLVSYIIILFVFRREALFCLHAEECDEENYEKLVRALCKNGNIPLYKIATKAELGELVGQVRFDLDTEFNR